MLDLGEQILAFIVAIGVLVTVHEFGHFWVARRLGFKVLRFSFGFGRPVMIWRGGAPDHTEYWLSLIPLGGYVKMLDEREAPVDDAAERPRAFNRRPVWQRIAVLLAGPGFNFLFAIVAYWVMFATGVPGIKTLIGAVNEGTVAARAGLKANDEIEAIGGRATGTWEAATLAIFEELLDDGIIKLKVREPSGNVKDVELDVRGRSPELTAPSALFAGLGMRPVPVYPRVIGEITPDSVAEHAGLRIGDEVLTADGVAIDAWDNWFDFIRQHPGARIDVTLLRDGAELTLPLTIGTVQEGGRTIGRIGAGPRPVAPSVLDSLRTEQRYNVIESLPRGVAKAWEMSALTVRMLGHMLVGNVSIKNMSGPITIATYAGESARGGLSTFLNFLAVVSISLGILNLLPIPLLDGGQVAFQLAEGLKGSPLSERAQMLGQQVGVVFLIALITFVFYNDLSRIFGS